MRWLQRAAMVGACLAPQGAWAVPSVPATPAQDVYQLLAANPGLQASIPFYHAAQVAGKFSSLTVIGDSYGDQGNALAYNPVSSQVGADGRYGNALNIVDALQYHYALPSSAVTNYAFGGATTGSINNNPPALMLPGFQQQIDALVASGRRFTPSDLISFTTAGIGGGNDGPTGISVAQGTANVAADIGTLIGLGAKNIVFDSQAATGTAALAAALTMFAGSGVTFTLFDGSVLTATVLASPTAYGFAADATATDYCTRFGGAHLCNEGGVNKARLQTTGEILAEDRYLYFYAHPTTTFAALIAQGETTLLDATTVPEPASMAILAAGLLAAVTTTRRSRT